MQKAPRHVRQEPAIVLIDEDRIARRTAIVREAATELIESRATHKDNLGSDIVLKRFLPSEKAQFMEFLADSGPVVTLVVIAEDELSTLRDGKQLPRIPCKSITWGYELIGKMGVENDLYFVTKDNITGLDVISMLLSGVRGVVDTEALGSSRMVRCLVQATREKNKKLNRIAVGRAYRRLDNLIDLARRKWQIGEPHWCLLLALAEIPSIRLPSPSKHTPKQNRIADEIRNYQEVTGYAVTSTTPRRLPLILELVAGELGILNDDELSIVEEGSAGRGRFLGHAEMLELPYLPLYARAIGLPSRILPVRELDQSQLASHLHKGLGGIETRDTQLCDGISVAHVTMARHL